MPPEYGLYLPTAGFCNQSTGRYAHELHVDQLDGRLSFASQQGAGGRAAKKSAVQWN